MRIAVTGSIATDHLMTFPGRFAEQLIPERLDTVSLSFLVDTLDIRRGGVAANIAHGLAVLGHTPALVGAVGADFHDYGVRLRSHGVDTGSVRISDSRHTARFMCTTDEDGNQLASFYTGAMAEAATIDLAATARRLGGIDLVLIGADDPQAMLRHTRTCRAHGHPFAADPSQQLARLDCHAVRELVTGAAYLFTNAYENALLLRKTGWSRAEVLERVGTWITTLGAKGCRIERADGQPSEVAAVPPEALVDPTGVGDAFRAGFLAGLAAHLDPVRCAQAGSAMAALVLAGLGSQNYTLDMSAFTRSVAAAYGPEAAADMARVLQKPH